VRRKVRTQSVDPLARIEHNHLLSSLNTLILAVLAPSRFPLSLRRTNVYRLSVLLVLLSSMFIPPAQSQSLTKQPCMALSRTLPELGSPMPQSA